MNNISSQTPRLVSWEAKEKISPTTYSELRLHHNTLPPPFFLFFFNIKKIMSFFSSTFSFNFKLFPCPPSLNPTSVLSLLPLLSSSNLVLYSFPNLGFPFSLQILRKISLTPPLFSLFNFSVSIILYVFLCNLKRSRRKTHFSEPILYTVNFSHLSFPWIL